MLNARLVHSNYLVAPFLEHGNACMAYLLRISLVAVPFHWHSPISRFSAQAFSGMRPETIVVFCCSHDATARTPPDDASLCFPFMPVAMDCHGHGRGWQINASCGCGQLPSVTHPPPSPIPPPLSYRHRVAQRTGSDVSCMSI